MSRYIVRRVALGVVTLLLMSVIVFLLINAAPGGPSAIVSMNATAAQRAALEKLYGLNQPIFVRYVQWLTQALRGNFGISYSLQQPVLEVIGEYFPNTALLAGTALILAMLIAIPLGTQAAIRRKSWFDRLASGINMIGLSVPDYWLAILGILVFSAWLRILPASGMNAASGGGGGGLIAHMVLPVSVLTFVFMPNIFVIAKSSMIEALRADYIRTARGKGASERRVIYVHALRNAFNPVLSVIGLVFAVLVGGDAIVETVFAWPGIGHLMVDATTQRDYPVMMGATMVIGASVIFINLVVDLLYGLLDPRVRYE
ncbi:MAG: diguanylate cyclase [Sulfobacillus acidophilus]|uniref:Diguanylate cyclase n=1 Tax=Sulfobacillus acidophilus TaxID=53633 RepID=A0A2T2WFL7_9FIRM|nr:MAG: diguanylate cyclase [Sulfobacillus acidophilus]